MFKKLGFFLFAMGVSASYAIAGGSDVLWRHDRTRG